MGFRPVTVVRSGVGSKTDGHTETLRFCCRSVHMCLPMAMFTIFKPEPSGPTHCHASHAEVPPSPDTTSRMVSYSSPLGRVGMTSAANIQRHLVYVLCVLYLLTYLLTCRQTFTQRFLKTLFSPPPFFVYCTQSLRSVRPLYLGPVLPLCTIMTRSRGGAGHGTLRVTRTGEQAGKALRSQGHHYARVM